MKRTRPENFAATTFNCKTPKCEAWPTNRHLKGYTKDNAGAATYAKGIIIHRQGGDGNNNAHITQARQMN